MFHTDKIYVNLLKFYPDPITLELLHINCFNKIKHILIINIISE